MLHLLHFTEKIRNGVYLIHLSTAYLSNDKETFNQNIKNYRFEKLEAKIKSNNTTSVKAI